MEPVDSLDARGDYEGLCGSVGTTNFSFAVGYTGSLARVYLVMLRDGVEDWKGDGGTGGVPAETVSDPGARALARKWLEQVGVDVAAMERSYPPHVRHHDLPFSHPDREKGLVSDRYSVRWASTDGPDQEGCAAEIGLCLATKHLVVMRINRLGLPFHRHPPPDLPHAVAVSQLPDEPVYRLFRFGVGTPLPLMLEILGNGYTNAFSLLETPRPYEEAMRRRMLEETRHIITVLGCTQLDDPRPENLTDLYVTPPAFGGGGRIAFKNGHVEFDTEGKLRSVDFVPRGQGDRVDWWHAAKSVITTNEAYQIATQKLAALSVDLDYLNSRYRRYLWRPPFWVQNAGGTNRTSKREWRQSPEYHLVWRDTNLPPQAPSTVKVSVYGDIKEVGTIELNDNACWRRPPVVVTNGARPL